MERKYANYLAVGQNREEFVLDFGQHFDAEAEPVIHTGIVTSPIYLRAFVRAIEDSLDSHDEKCLGERAAPGQTELE